MLMLFCVVGVQDVNFFRVFERCYDIIVFHDGLSEHQMQRIRRASQVHSTPGTTQRCACT
jgi:hypothetical protein